MNAIFNAYSPTGIAYFSLVRDPDTQQLSFTLFTESVRFSVRALLPDMFEEKLTLWADSKINDDDLYTAFTYDITATDKLPNVLGTFSAYPLTLHFSFDWIGRPVIDVTSLSTLWPFANKIRIPLTEYNGLVWTLLSSFGNRKTMQLAALSALPIKNADWKKVLE